jgi:hypothetical protein
MPEENQQSNPELDTANQRIAELEAKLKKAEFSEYAEGLIRQNKLLPAQKERVVAVMMSLPDAEQIEFAEGDETKKESPLQAYKTFLESQSTSVEFNEIAADADSLEYVEPTHLPPGSQVDKARAALDAKAQAYMKQHPEIEYMEAVRIVEAKR